MKQYNAITFCIDSYKENHYDSLKKENINYIEMYDDIAAFIRIAVKNGYQMRIWSDEYCVVIEYDIQDEDLGGTRLVWLGENEYIESEERSETKNEGC